MGTYYMLGTPGSGKSYHMLEIVLSHLGKGGYVIANFPLRFTEGMVRRGHQDRFMYVPDDVLMGGRGVHLLIDISMKNGWFKDGKIKEGHCLVVLDECSNHFPPDGSSHPVQKVWATFFRQHRKFKYDIYIITQDKNDINRRIRGVVEYTIEHRCANAVFPFKLLPFKIFMYLTYWKKSKIATGSSILVKKFADLYNTHMLFGQIDKEMEKVLIYTTEEEMNFDANFGNLKDLGMGLEGPAQAGGAKPVPDLHEVNDERKAI